VLKNYIKKPLIIENKYSVAGGLIKSIANYSLSGFKAVSNFTLNERLNTCKSCEYWDSSGFRNTGKCNKCGCSTWAKLRMATEQCPIEKWKSETLESNQ
jgi:hypothetical protein